MKTSSWAIVIVLITTILTSAGQVLYKLGTNSLSGNAALIKYILNGYILSGLAAYLFGAVLLITALKYGELSVLYPIIATSYIWVSLASMYFFGEMMNSFKWAGVIAVIIGVSLIGFGSRTSGATGAARAEEAAEEAA